MADRVIAMSFPAAGQTALYRNPVVEVARFFKTKHPGHYLVVNTCGEAGFDYDPALFEGHVVRYYVADHNPPALR